MGTRGALGQVIVLILLAAFGGVVGTATLLDTSVEDGISPGIHPAPLSLRHSQAEASTEPQAITNTAVIAVPGYQPMSRTAAITITQAPDQLDLSPSYKVVSPQEANYGERVTYTVVIQDDTDPQSHTALLANPTGCQELLQVGGFEGNSDTVFSHWHAGEPFAFKHQSRYIYEGSMSMRLHASMGDYPDCPAYHPYLWQAVTIPDGITMATTMVIQGQQLVAGSLAPCSNPESYEADDVLYLQMRDSGGNNLGTPQEIANGGAPTEQWKAFELGVTDEADLYMHSHPGEEVQIYFYATHDEDFNDTWFYLDGLECQMCTESLIRLTDTVPDGLSYVSGTLTATIGTVTDSAAPTLRWSGVLSPTPSVTVTYAATVSTTRSQIITNTAAIAAPGSQPISRTAMLCSNSYRAFLPRVLRTRSYDQ